MNRRSFIGWGAKVGAALALVPLAPETVKATVEVKPEIPDVANWNRAYRGDIVAASSLSGIVQGDTGSVQVVWNSGSPAIGVVWSKVDRGGH